MKVILYSIAFYVLIVLNGCTYPQDRSSTELHASQKTQLDFNYTGSLHNLNKIARKEFEISEAHQKQDTLSFIVMNRNVFYPFGRLKAIAKLRSMFPHFDVRNELQRDSLTGNNTLTRFYTKKSFLKFVKSDDTGLYEIVSGRIYDGEVVLYSKISIGMPMEVFLNLFFSKRINKFTENTKVIELVSGVDGVWQRYQFKDHFLSSIKIDTDYTFDQK